MIWEYYKELATKSSIKNGEEQPYSVAWFYRENEPEQLNALTRAFLGDQAALEAMQCISGEEVEEEMNRIRPLCAETPNPIQLKAIAHAIRDDISLIQGPPGTGKTQTICNILRCLISLPQPPSIAVVSANGEAIRNIITMVNGDELMRNRYAYLGGQRLRQEFYDIHREAPWAECFSRDNGYRFSAQMLHDFPIIFSTIHSLRKNFVEDEAFTGIFDYVIVDECSQVGCVTGLLAMASAGKLVLLGDDLQLPPIFPKVGRMTVPTQDIPALYLDRGDNSFMKAVAGRFEGHAGKTFLAMHYRCHPAIIGYCNQYVYDHRLQICTRDDGKLPIRIRWYEGDYWERILVHGKKTNQNQKQISVFMEEEYPQILARLRADEDYTVCVLSPYSYPLKQLKEAMIAYDNEIEAHFTVPENESEEQEPVENIPQLTIHKAQGRGYDLVVLLTIKDCGPDTWPQRREIVNVAVSRAKKELLIVSSSIWMLPEMQKELLGYSVDCRVQDDQLYLRYMMSYVREESLHRKVGNYGLQRSALRSVFDRVPYFRKQMNAHAEDGSPSAPELCMLRALGENEDIAEHYEIFREVPLSDIDAIQPPDDICAKYIEDGARFDIILVQNNKLCAVIEVDGSYHREDREQKNRDALKDAAVASLGCAFEGRYFRFPTDGTSVNEVAKVVEALQGEGDDLPDVDTTQWIKYDQKGAMMREELINMLNQMIRTSMQNLTDDLESGDQDRINRVLEAYRRLSFRRDDLPNIDYSDPVCCDLYLARYGYAYAFEYAVIYDAVIRNYAGMEQNANGRHILGLSSLACGSMIDAWSMAYALACIREAGTTALPDDLRLTYHGTDLTKWGRLFAGYDELVQDPTVNRCYMHNPTTRDLHIGISDFFRSETNYHWLNTMCFAKFLNELTEDELEDLEASIREAVERGCFVEDNNKNRKEYFICISHSASTVDGINDERRLAALASRVIGALNVNHCFDVDPRILDISPYCNVRNDAGQAMGLVCEEGDIPMYRFSTPFGGNGRPYSARFNQLNADFWGDEEVNQLKRRLEELLSEALGGPCRKAMEYATTLRFQVIKLTRRAEEEE